MVLLIGVFYQWKALKGDTVTLHVVCGLLASLVLFYTLNILGRSYSAGPWEMGVLCTRCRFAYFGYQVGVLILVVVI